MDWEKTQKQFEAWAGSADNIGWYKLAKRSNNDYMQKETQAAWRAWRERQSDIDAKDKEILKLREALEFYANDAHWTADGACAVERTGNHHEAHGYDFDFGFTAQDALNKEQHYIESPAGRTRRFASNHSNFLKRYIMKNEEIKAFIETLVDAEEDMAENAAMAFACDVHGIDIEDGYEYLILADERDLFPK